MKKNNENLILLSMIFSTALVIANVVSGKVIQTNIPLFGSTITFPGAVFCYSITFLVTDIVGEIWGKKEANRIVKYGFIAQVLATILIVLTGLLPAADKVVNESYKILLGQNVIFVIGSLVAYVISQSWDVWVFHKIRNKIMKKEKNNKSRWIWNNLSTMSSQIIDTIIFITIAFGIGYKWLFDIKMLGTLGAMIIGQYLVKLVLAIVDTPFFYFFTRNTKEK